MIYDPAHSLSAGQSALVSHITGEVCDFCGDALGLEGSDVEEIARAVEHFVDVQNIDGAVDANYLIMLASQALQSLGEDRAARRLLLFGTGLVRPAEWVVTGNAAMWVLDLRQITVRDDAPLELVLFNSLTMILDSVAELWDATEGSGVLGLRHVTQSAQALVGDQGKKGHVSALAQEIKDVCARKLAHLGEERCWTSAPHVMDLDA